jgi:hypothetical protein
MGGYWMIFKLDIEKHYTHVDIAKKILTWTSN